MKKNIKKIAIILLLIMIFNIFSGCISTITFNHNEPDSFGGYVTYWVLVFPFTLALDIITSPVQLIFLLWFAAVWNAELPIDDDDGIFLAEIINLFPKEEQEIILVKINNMSEQRQEAFIKSMRIFFTLPQEDRLILLDTMYSFSKENFEYFSNTINNMTDTEILAKVEYLYSFEKTEISRQLKNSKYLYNTGYGNNKLYTHIINYNVLTEYN